MARKRFNTAEKAVIAAGATGEPGTDVEWQNVTQWHAARIITGEIITDDGWQAVEVITLTGTRTFSAGQVIHVSPGHIRARYGYNPGNVRAPTTARARSRRGTAGLTGTSRTTRPRGATNDPGHRTTDRRQRP